jgi:hypothetical protein
LEDCEFEASLGYTVRPCLKTTKKNLKNENSEVQKYNNRKENLKGWGCSSVVEELSSTREAHSLTPRFNP